MNMLKSQITRYALFTLWVGIVLCLLLFVFYTMAQKTVKNTTQLRSGAVVRVQNEKAQSASDNTIPRFDKRAVKIQYPTSTMNMKVYYPADMVSESLLNGFRLSSVVDSTKSIQISRASLGQITSAYDYVMALQKTSGKVIAGMSPFSNTQGVNGYDVSYNDEGADHWSIFLADGHGAIYVFDTTSNALLNDLHAIAKGALIFTSSRAE